MIKPILPEDFAAPEVTMKQLVEWYNANAGETQQVSLRGWRTKPLGVAACQALMKRIDEQIAFEEETDHLSDEEFQAQMMAELEASAEEERQKALAEEAKKAIKAGTKPGDDKARQVTNQPAVRLASNSLGIAASWQDEAVKKARTTRNRVEVIHNNIREEHKSVRAAFVAYGLPDEKHIRFRMKLKQSLAEVFEWNGEKFEFLLVAREEDTK